ncbi:MAG: GNAT family N-acetyltransferase [Candidatus Nanopelagicales bacterium]
MLPTVVVIAHTFASRPDLASVGIPSAEVWPEYNLHGDVLNRLWGPLCDELPAFQAVLVEKVSGPSQNVLAEIHTGPLSWDGHDDHLPTGIDDALEQVVSGSRAGHPTDTLCALAAEVSPHARGRGLAEIALRAMADIAREHGYQRLIAPVRPSHKERYPLTPIERYVTWQREDGYSRDPWIRVHQRIGGRVATPLPRSLRISGTVAEWEDWTGMAFPESAEYVFPHGLATVRIDRDSDVGLYYEPNVWVVHDLVNR